MPFIFVGDTHGDVEYKLSDERLPDSFLNSNEAKYLFICGDFGVIWRNSIEQEEKLKWLKNRNFFVCFIDGNHENFDILESFPVEFWNGGKVHRICDNIFHLMRGQVFTILDKKIFTFGGANSIDKHIRIPNISWWPREMPSEAEYLEGLRNLKNANNKIDIIITHTCSTRTLYNLPASIFGANKPQIDSLNKYLDLIENTVSFKLWVFGHFHIDMEVDDRHVVLYQEFLN